MKKIFNRICSILLGCALCCSTGLTTFAAENTVSNVNSVLSATSNGQVLYAKTATLYNGNGSISITTSEGNWSAQFSVSIAGNPSADYYVSIKGPGNYSDTFGFMYGNGKGTTISKLYAPPGTYTVYVVLAEGSATDVTGIFQILD